MKKLSRIVESTWGDIARRAEGEEIRKEDDINNLDIDDFYEYFTSIYKINKSICDENIFKYEEQYAIIVPIYMDKWEQLYYITLNMKPYDIYMDYGKIFAKRCEELYNKMVDEYSTEFTKEEFRDFGTIQTKVDYLFHIKPKDGSEVTNRFFLELVDFILENSDKAGTNIIIKNEEIK